MWQSTSEHIHPMSLFLSLKNGKRRSENLYRAVRFASHVDETNIEIITFVFLATTCNHARPSVERTLYCSYPLIYVSFEALISLDVRLRKSELTANTGPIRKSLHLNFIILFLFSLHISIQIVGMSIFPLSIR